MNIYHTQSSGFPSFHPDHLFLKEKENIRQYDYKAKVKASF